MNSSERITVVCATDNHYLVLLAALLKSIEVNHQSEEIIDFYIVGDMLSSSNMKKFNSSFSSSKIQIHWLKMNNVIPSEIKLPSDYSSYPKNIYMRLFIPYFLPLSIEKAIYLDVDMLILADIRELWKVDLSTNIIGAVTDPIDTVGDPYGGIANFEEHGMQPTAKFFNTGLLIMNLAEWRKNDITQQVINCVTENKKYAKLPDQYGLNVVAHGRWLELDQLWNCVSDSNLEKPFLIHFSHRKPIYKSYNKNEEYKKLFFKYLSSTEWKTFKLIGEPKRYLKKMFNVFEKFI